LTQIWREPLAKGIVINGLPIMVKEPSYSTVDIDNLDWYYEDLRHRRPGILYGPDQGPREFQGGDPHEVDPGGGGPNT
jgi:hypothetical protein